MRQFTLFNAEMAALYMSIAWACCNMKHQTQLHVFEDNKGALQKIVNLDNGPSQRMGIC